MQQDLEVSRDLRGSKDAGRQTELMQRLSISIPSSRSTRELVVASASKTGKVVTVEEHSVIGGLGSAVAEVLCEEAADKAYAYRCE